MSRPHLIARRLVLAAFVGVLAPGRPSIAKDLPLGVLRDWIFYNDAGWRAFDRGNLALAENRFHLAIRVVKPYEADDKRLLARSYVDLARVLYEQKRYAEAEPLAAWALSVREAHPRVKPEGVFQSLFLLAQIDRAQRKYEKAEPLLVRALALQEKIQGPNHADSALPLDVLAGIYTERGKFQEADSLYKREITVLEKSLPAGHADVAEASEHYAAMLRRANRIPEAKTQEARATEIRTAIAEAQRAARTRANPSSPGFKGFR